MEITPLRRLADPHSNRAFQIAVSDLGKSTLNVILKTDVRSKNLKFRFCSLM